MRTHTHTHIHTHTHTQICILTKKDAIVPWAATWMELQGVRLSDTTQTKREANTM